MKLKKKKEKRDKINPRQMRKDYVERMEGELKDQGVVLFGVDNDFLSIDENYLKLLPDMTEVPSRELGNYLNAFTQQKVYLRSLGGRISLMLEYAKREYEKVYSPLYATYTNKKMSETAKSTLINAEESVVEKYHEYADLQRKSKIIEDSISNIEDVIFMLSREVTRRSGDFNNDTRLHNVSKK